VNLTFTTSRYGALRGHADSGLELFTISPSTARGDKSVTLSTDLPGLGRLRIEPPANAEEYGSEAERRAMGKAGKVLERWAAEHLGVDLSVNVIDNA
jgi:hypothetical protein